MDENEKREIIAGRIAKEINDGDVVNLGIGLPEMVADYIDPEIDVVFQAENGILMMGGKAEPGKENKNIINAGCKHVTVRTGASFFDSSTSFSLIRGGHVDVTVLGVLEVDRRGSFASHKIPGKKVPGMGGAMDLVSGARRVIIATTHNKKNGTNTIVEKLSLPATAIAKADLIVTELAVFSIGENGLILEEIDSSTNITDLYTFTGCSFEVSQDLKTYGF